MSKKIKLFCTLVLLATTISNYNMEQRLIPSGSRILLPSGRWVEIVGDILLDKAQIKDLPHFSDLPSEIVQHIIALLGIHASAKSLTKAAKNIYNLSLVNKQLNTLINNPPFCLKLIHHLAWKFNCSDQEVAEALQTKAAKERLEIQIQLCNLCATANPTIEAFQDLISQGVDLNFTCYNNTVNMLHLTNIKLTVVPLIEMVKYPNIVQFFLKNGANVNRTDQVGYTALMIACMGNNIESALILMQDPHCVIDQKDIYESTALMHAIAKGDFYELPEEMTIIQNLLDSGADPEIADDLYGSPMQLAKDNLDDKQKNLLQAENANQIVVFQKQIDKLNKLVQLFQNAIDKKNGKKV